MVARPHATADAGDAAASRVYAQHGNQRADLRNPASVAQLISRSPQLGDGSLSADRRCGTAAIFNGMLMSGDPAASARGIRAVAATVDREATARMEADFRRDGLSGADLRMALQVSPSVISPEADAALRRMESGRLSPREAATLQDTLFSIGMSRHYSGDAHPTGLSRRELEPLMRDLASNGAFGASTVTLHNRYEPNSDALHWTVSTTPPGGTPLHADSWPAADGQGTVRPGGPTGRYQADITIRPD